METSLPVWGVVAAIAAGVLLGGLVCALLLMRRMHRHTLQQQQLEFRLLAQQVLEEKHQTFAQHSQASIETLLQPLRQQIDAFSQRIQQLHDQAQRGNVALEGEIRRVLEVGLHMRDEAQSLARALKGDKKLAGTWGEAQLEQTLQLAGLVRGDHYQTQVNLKDAQGQDRRPDVLVSLPDGKRLVIDSKVSLVDYDRAMAAQDDATRLACLDAHVKAVRAHVEDLARKDYSHLTGVRSPGFVLMFLPIEAAYIAAMQHDRNLFDESYRRNVVLVSHTTLLPVLKTVANVWMLAQGNAQALEISDRAGDIYNQVALLAERLERLGGSLDTVGRHYNNVITALTGQQGLYGKVARFQHVSARAHRNLPPLRTVQTQSRPYGLTGDATVHGADEPAA